MKGKQEIPLEPELLRRDIEDAPTKQRSLYAKALEGKLSPRRAIAIKCHECCAWERFQPSPDGKGIDMIRDCGVRRCPLWAYRPFQKTYPLSDADGEKALQGARK